MSDVHRGSAHRGSGLNGERVEEIHTLLGSGKGGGAFIKVTKLPVELKSLKPPPAF